MDPGAASKSSFRVQHVISGVIYDFTTGKKCIYTADKYIFKSGESQYNRSNLAFITLEHAQTTNGLAPSCPQCTTILLRNPSLDNPGRRTTRLAISVTAHVLK